MRALSKQFLNEFIPLFKKRYLEVVTEKEQVDLIYNTQLDGTNLLDLFEQSIDRDRVLQYTSMGIHKDDLSFINWIYLINDIDILFVFHNI